MINAANEAGSAISPPSLCGDTMAAYNDTSVLSVFNQREKNVRT